MSARRFSRESPPWDDYCFGQRRSNKNMNAMPGPEFNGNPAQKGWFARHSQKIVLSLIVLLLIVGGYYFYKSYQQRQALLRPALESLANEAPSENNAPAAPIVTAAPAQSQMTAAAIPEVRKQGSDFMAKAARGDGATHLARQALREYLKDKTDAAGQLKAEQKIYIEDYLQKHVTHANVLKVGDEMTFSSTLIDDAITQAQKLTDKQISNLHQYVLLVPSL